MAPKLKQRFLGMNMLMIIEDNLIEVIEQIKQCMVMQDEKFAELESSIEKRVTEQQIGDYFKRIAKKLQTRDLEESSHKFKLTDPTFLQADYEDESSQHLRDSVEAVISKLDTILQSVLRNKKTNDHSQAKVYEMEQTLKEFLTVTRFREDVQRMETRLT